MRKHQQYSSRKYVLIAILTVTALIYLSKLAYIQIIEDKYKILSYSNVRRTVTLYPSRGLIYDRNNKLLVSNDVAYDLMVIPKQVKKIDTLRFCRLVGISTEDFMDKLSKAQKYSRYKSSVFEAQISKETYGYLQEKLFEFPGFFVQARAIRKYDQDVAAHVLGYVSEVNRRDLEQDEYYKSGDYIGKTGLEKFYEKELRGEKGKAIKVVDVFNREKGSFENGKYDEEPTAGKNIYTSIDRDLQEFGEELMKNKRGSIVAIEPATGEILSLVSSPAFDPNLLIGRERGKNFTLLSRDTLKPLFNRTVSARYPPGSTFKMMNALIGLQEGTLDEHTQYSCQGPESSPIRCTHYHTSPLNVRQSIEISCNPFYWNVFRAILENPKYANIYESYNKWRDYVLSFGLDAPFDTDILSQRKASVPATDYFDRYYRKNHWKAITVRSLSIGQGEIELSPLQLANYTAAIANRGYFYEPHLARAIGENDDINLKETKKRITKIDPKNFEIVIDGMENVYLGEEGTARWYQTDSLSICGKTGTAENPHGEDHSVFIAFAPRENPKIAIAVVIENGGFGSTWAAPIATLMIEKYLRGETKDSWFKEKMRNEHPIDK